MWRTSNIIHLISIVDWHELLAVCVPACQTLSSKLTCHFQLWSAVSLLIIVGSVLQVAQEVSGRLDQIWADNNVPLAELWRWRFRLVSATYIHIWCCEVEMSTWQQSLSVDISSEGHHIWIVVTNCKLVLYLGRLLKFIYLLVIYL